MESQVIIELAGGVAEAIHRGERRARVRDVELQH